MNCFPEEPLHLTESHGSGYFAGYPGLKLHGGRYTIIGKLGWGPRSSTWLVKDSQDDECYAALKVLTAHESRLGIEESNIASAATGYFTSLIDSFLITSNHGHEISTHQCFVFPAQSVSIEDLRLTSPTGALSATLVRWISSNALVALNKVHKAGFVHGHVSAGNFYFETVDEIENVEYLWEKHEVPPCVVEEWVTVDTRRYPIVRSHPIPLHFKWDTPIESAGPFDIRVANFAYLQKANTVYHPSSWEGSRMPRAIRPPEAVLELPHSQFKADIWQFGCMVFHLLTGEPMVPNDKALDDTTMFSWLVAMAGGEHEIPWNLVAQSSLIGPKFFTDGVYGHEIPRVTLEERIHAKAWISPEDIPGIVWFLRVCLCMNPDHRFRVMELWRCKWLAGYYD